MRILQISVVDSKKVFVWAENPGMYDALPSLIEQGDKSLKDSVNLHPYALDRGEIMRLLDPLKGRGRRMELTISSRTGTPLPSPEARDFIFRKVPSAKDIDKFLVDGVLLDLESAFRFLFRISRANESFPAVLGSSVLVLMAIASLAANLVERGRLLPALTARSAGKVILSWIPAPLHEDIVLLRELSRSAPLTLSACGNPVESHPGELVVGMLFQMVDIAARTALNLSDTVSPIVGIDELAGQKDNLALLLSSLYEKSPQKFRDPNTKIVEALEVFHDNVANPVEKFKTCFRVVEPDENGTDDDWGVEFLAQSVDDPSLFIPAEEIWDHTEVAMTIASPGEDPAESFLADLGRALRVCPDFESALSVTRPVAMVTDRIGIQRFLGNYSGVLEQSGFTVIVPSWFTDPSSRLGLRLKQKGNFVGSADRVGGASFTKEGLAEFDYVVAIGDKTLTKEEIYNIAKLKAPLIRFRGAWVQVSQEDLKHALLSIEKKPTEKLGILEIIKVAGGLSKPALGLPITGIDATGVLASFLDGSVAETLKTVVAPKEFNGELRPYQLRGLSWLRFLDSVGIGACLADDMGLGKTIQLISLLLSEREELRGDLESKRHIGLPPTLLIAPMSLVGNWQREVERFAGSLRVTVHHGQERLGGDMLKKAAAASDLVITTYGIVARDLDVLSDIKWGRVVLDEAQAIKNSNTNQFKAISSIPAARKIALTGTPVENRLTELWSIMEYLNPGLLGSKSGFKTKFSIPIERYGDNNAAKRLKTITAPFILRRLKTDKKIISDLPEKLEMKVYCNLSAEQASLYQSVVNNMMNLISGADGMERRGLILSTLLRLKQICDHPALFSVTKDNLFKRSGKLDRLESIVEEIVSVNEKAIVFSQFAEMSTMLADYFSTEKAIPTALIKGDVSKARRDEIVERFQGDGGPTILVSSLKSGGVGLNLTAANHVIHFDRWWNPAVEDQATDRAYRIGQTKDVQVRKLICIGTLEEMIDDVIEGKRTLSKKVIGSGDGWLTELSTDDLISVIRLSSEAMEEI